MDPYEFTEFVVARIIMRSAGKTLQEVFGGGHCCGGFVFPTGTFLEYVKFPIFSTCGLPPELGISDVDSVFPGKLGYVKFSVCALTISLRKHIAFPPNDAGPDVCADLEWLPNTPQVVLSLDFNYSPKLIHL